MTATYLYLYNMISDTALFVFVLRSLQFLGIIRKP